MRCLVKAIACHGLGLYIYAGEDLPLADEVPEKLASMKTIVQNDLADASDKERGRLGGYVSLLAELFVLEDYDAAIGLIKEITEGDPTQVNILRGLGDPLHWKALGVYRAKLKADATKLAQKVAIDKMNESPALGGKSDF